MYQSLCSDPNLKDILPCCDPNMINPAFWLDPNMMDPAYFDTNAATSAIFTNPDLWEIEMIQGEECEKGSWNTNYRFYERFSGKDMCLLPYRAYRVYREKGF